MRPKKVILCVDDNTVALSVRKLVLETRGYLVLAAASSELALETFRELNNGGIDLVLTDLLMPSMDGNELVCRMKEINPSVPAIIVSGVVKSYDRANQADAFLPKGFPIEATLDRIKVLITRKRGPKKGWRTRLQAVEAEVVA